MTIKCGRLTDYMCCAGFDYSFKSILSHHINKMKPPLSHNTQVLLDLHVQIV